MEDLYGECRRFPEEGGPFPLGNHPTTGPRERACTIATLERYQNAAQQHFSHSAPPQAPPHVSLGKSQPDLASPFEATSHPLSLSWVWFSLPLPPIFLKCILPTPQFHSLGPGPCHPGLGVAGVTPPVHLPPSRGISMYHLYKWGPPLLNAPPGNPAVLIRGVQDLEIMVHSPSGQLCSYQTEREPRVA